MLWATGMGNTQICLTHLIQLSAALGTGAAVVIAALITLPLTVAGLNVRALRSERPTAGLVRPDSWLRSTIQPQPNGDWHFEPIRRTPGRPTATDRSVR